MFDIKPRIRDPRRVITTVYFNQQELIQNILVLHNKNLPIHLDITYNKGGMWTGIPGPGIKTDIKPVDNGTMPADSKGLPFKNNTIKSVMFDPPFLADARQARMARRYGVFENINELMSMYSQSIKEIYRVLTFKGLLIFKCQDTAYNHKNIFLNYFIMEKALETGLDLNDVFILVNDNFILQWNLEKQEHARKTHCYFLIFKKPVPRPCRKIVFSGKQGRSGSAVIVAPNFKK